MVRVKGNRGTGPVLYMGRAFPPAETCHNGVPPPLRWALVPRKRGERSDLLQKSPAVLPATARPNKTKKPYPLKVILTVCKGRISLILFSRRRIQETLFQLTKRQLNIPTVSNCNLWFSFGRYFKASGRRDL